MDAADAVELLWKTEQFGPDESDERKASRTANDQSVTDPKTPKNGSSESQPFDDNSANARRLYESIFKTNELGIVLCTDPSVNSDSKPVYECILCGLLFRKKSFLRRHYRVHTGERPFKCSDCDSTFARSDALQSHMRSHTGEKPYQCPFCSSRFSHSSQCKIHQRRAHTHETPYVCDGCGLRFFSLADKKKHSCANQARPVQSEVVSNGSTSSPSSSLLLLSSSSSSSSNKLTISSRVSAPFKCDVCGTSFAMLSSLIFHKKTHTKTPVAGDREKTLAPSMSMQNPVVPVAKPVATQPKQTNGSPTSPVQNKPKIWVCVTCSTRFTKRLVFEAHRRTCKGLPCNRCGQVFKSQAKLDLHHRKFHRFHGPFVCDECGASFRRKCDLIHHLPSHMTIKPFDCSICKRGFSTANYLDRHMRMTHPGEASTTRPAVVVVGDKDVAAGPAEVLRSDASCQPVFPSPMI